MCKATLHSPITHKSRVVRVETASEPFRVSLAYNGLVRLGASKWPLAFLWINCIPRLLGQPFHYADFGTEPGATAYLCALGGLIEVVAAAVELPKGS